jgi:hypothetical protein
MDLIEGSETSAKLNLTPGKYPKENIQDSEQGENLKSRLRSHEMHIHFVYWAYVNQIGLVMAR